MDLTEPHRRLLALCAIRVDKLSVDWNLLAREAIRELTLDRLWAGHLNEKSQAATKAGPTLLEGLKDKDGLLAKVDEEIAAAEGVGAKLVTVLDSDYPANLRLIPNLPPFLFYQGSLEPADSRSVAVVGTRNPSERGLKLATQMATKLVAANVTVTSGLARGIDTAAHRAALDSGGRTIAVLGTGITKCYPKENAELAEEIVERGALVSQFWPSRSGGRDSFPRRNVVTSGISQGSVVVEASSTSGAKMQARIALEHGKHVFLLRSLVTDQVWAQSYLERGAIEVADIDDVLQRLADPESVQLVSHQRQQLSLALL